MCNLSPNLFTLLKLHSWKMTEEAYKAALTAISLWMAQLCSDMPLTNVNNLTEYQHLTRTLCDHYGTRQKQYHSIIKSKQR